MWKIPRRRISKVETTSASKISWRSQPWLKRAVPPSPDEDRLDDPLHDVADGVGEGFLADQAAVDQGLGEVLALADAPAGLGQGSRGELPLVDEPPAQVLVLEVGLGEEDHPPVEIDPLLDVPPGKVQDPRPLRQEQVTEQLRQGLAAEMRLHAASHSPAYNGSGANIVTRGRKGSRVHQRALRLAALGVLAFFLGAAPAETVDNSNFGHHPGPRPRRPVRRRGAARPGLGRLFGPPVAFLDAFVDYWRLLYDDKNATLQAAFDKRLTRTISLAQARLDKNPKDGEAAVLGGTAHVLRAQLLGRQKKAMAAANEAKRGRRILLTTQDPDALFGLGSYNYSIDQLQGAARSLRAVMGIPGGDRDEGLRQLERAAREGRRFGLEARLLLMSIYVGKREHQLDEAWRQAERLEREHGDAVVALDAAARPRSCLGARTRRRSGWTARSRKARVPTRPSPPPCASSARAASSRASDRTRPWSGSRPSSRIPRCSRPGSGTTSRTRRPPPAPSRRDRRTTTQR
jgi:hypothetical protein